MMSDEKALRAAELLRKYCNERCCGECVFVRKNGYCAIGSAHHPALIVLDDLKPKQTEVHDG